MEYTTSRPHGCGDRDCAGRTNPRRETRPAVPFSVTVAPTVEPEPADTAEDGEADAELPAFQFAELDVEAWRQALVTWNARPNADDMAAWASDHRAELDAIAATYDGGGKRVFDTGASRDTDAGKHDFDGFLSPLVVHAFGAYMTRNRRMADGSVRASDNWQKGMPLDAYMKSGWRHFVDWWTIHRGWPMVRPETGADVDLVDALCGLLFNVQGYLHEILRAELGDG